MKFAKVTERLNGLGSEKWAVHIEGKRRAELGEPMIFLSIGEPDAPPPAAILDEANRQMRAGRLRYAEGRGEELGGDEAEVERVFLILAAQPEY